MSDETEPATIEARHRRAAEAAFYRVYECEPMPNDLEGIETTAGALADQEAAIADALASNSCPWETLLEKSVQVRAATWVHSGKWCEE